ncbi:MAG: MFS transporter [Anaerolineales bacterium]
MSNGNHTPDNLILKATLLVTSALTAMAGATIAPAATAAQTGLALGVMTLSSALAAALYGWLAARLNHITMLILTFALSGVSYVLFSPATSWTLIFSGLALSGLGIGLLSPNLNVWLMNATPVALRGRVLGGFTTILSLGQFGAPLISQPLSQVVGIAATFGSVGATLQLLGLVLVTARQPVGWLTTG